VLIDLGGVLIADHWADTASSWAERLGTSPAAFLAAVFGGNEETVLVGRSTEDEWWGTVRRRLDVSPSVLVALRADVDARERWDEDVVRCLRCARGRARTAIVSNTWPGTRARMARQGRLDVTDDLVFSCEVGWAKPDPRIFAAALGRLGLTAGDVLFVDDTAGHVAVAPEMGMVGHVHTSAASTITVIYQYLSAA
jgi:putative hydrolase of the HAD superfamily